MKKITFTITSFFFFLLFAQAQTNVTLKVHSKLGDVDFAFNQGAKNNVENDFIVDRLEFYMSGFSLVHDGGMETAIDNSLHVLVDANKPTEVDLGEHEITELEAIRFHIGVHPDYNHEDPSAYPLGHPLAPTSPSMHWGWAAGYRFLAMEGFGGSNFNQLFQLHGLEDDNYFMAEVPLSLSASNGEIIINIDGDYTRALEDIHVDFGVIEHSGSGAAKKALENFRDFVFTESDQASSTIDFAEVTGFVVYPNPTEGSVNVSLRTSKELPYQVSVVNMLGQQIRQFDEVKGNGNLSFDLEQKGIYTVNLIKEGQSVIQQKVVVQ